MSLSKLAKDTSIYGLSSILARMINFLFVPLYTRALATSDFGIYTELIAYVGLLGVVLTFGLETGYFRFASKDPSKAEDVFTSALNFLGFVGLAFFLLTWLFAGSLSQLMGYSIWALLFAAAILAIDSYTALLFARLRLAGQSMRFAVFRIIKILSEVLANLALFYGLPAYFSSHPDSFLLHIFTPEPSYIYIFGAILCSCIVSLLLFIPEIIRTPLKISRKVLLPVLIYSLPLMLSGIQGVMNDFLGRFMFRFLSPANQSWESLLGIFNANSKLAVMMLMFVQMFRYAADPFFFKNAHQTDTRQQQALVMKYFTLICVIIFLFITAYSDLFALFLGPAYRVGIGVLPILLMANLLMGINQNLSMWYKLAEQTKVALFITFLGLLSSFIVLVVLLPVIGYYGAAIAQVVSYLIMILISWQLSKRHYHIPYQWKRIVTYIVLGLLIFATSFLYANCTLWIRLVLNTVGILVFVYIISKLEVKLVTPVLKFINTKVRLRKE